MPRSSTDRMTCACGIVPTLMCSVKREIPRIFLHHRILVATSSGVPRMSEPSGCASRRAGSGSWDPNLSPCQDGSSLQHTRGGTRRLPDRQTLRCVREYALPAALLLDRIPSLSACVGIADRECQSVRGSRRWSQGPLANHERPRGRSIAVFHRLRPTQAESLDVNAGRCPDHRVTVGTC